MINMKCGDDWAKGSLVIGQITIAVCMIENSGPFQSENQ